MWGGGGGFGPSEGGGGFVSSTHGDAGQFGSPAGQGEKSGKGRRSQNIVPVTIKQLNECQEDTFKILDTEAQVVTFVGLVTAVEPTTTKISVHMDDQTGTMEAFYYVGSEGDQSDIPILPVEGTYGRVVGSLRTVKGSKYVVIFKYLPVTDMNELTCHILEVIQVPIKLKRLKEAEAQKTGVGLQQGGMSNTLSNSMVASNFGGGTENAIKKAFGEKQGAVLEIIQGAVGESGIHRDEIIRNLQNKVTAKEIATIIEQLSGEGHIYSTVDDDHYRSTD